MTNEIENFLARRNVWLKEATDIIKRHSPLLSDAQAREIAIIALKSWQDLRSTIACIDSTDFLLSL